MRNPEVFVVILTKIVALSVLSAPLVEWTFLSTTSCSPTIIMTTLVAHGLHSHLQSFIFYNLFITDFLQCPIFSKNAVVHLVSRAAVFCHGQFHKMTAKILNTSSINNERRALYSLHTTRPAERGGRGDKLVILSRVSILPRRALTLSTDLLIALCDITSQKIRTT